MDYGFLDILKVSHCKYSYRTSFRQPSTHGCASNIVKPCNEETVPKKDLE